jgi:hypothetical protein
MFGSHRHHLLGALPPAEAQRWMPLLESVDLPLGHVLYESGAALEPRVLSDDRHRLSPVRHGKWRLG